MLNPDSRRFRFLRHPIEYPMHECYRCDNLADMLFRDGDKWICEDCRYEIESATDPDADRDLREERNKED